MDATRVLQTAHLQTSQFDLYIVQPFNIILHVLTPAAVLRDTAILTSGCPFWTPLFRHHASKVAIAYIVQPNT
jgi:hypothetical protein